MLKRVHKNIPSFFRTQKNRTGIGLYIKCNYYTFLVHTMKGNEEYYEELHLKNQYFFVYGCDACSKPSFWIDSSLSVV